MTNEEILRKAIEKAVKGGFNSPFEVLEFKHTTNDDFLNNQFINGLIFSHDFVKAFFGNELLCYDCGEKVRPPRELKTRRATIVIGTGNCDCCRQFENNEEAWEYHLQQMVLEKDPIKYLEQFSND